MKSAKICHLMAQTHKNGTSKTNHLLIAVLEMLCCDDTHNQLETLNLLCRNVGLPTRIFGKKTHGPAGQTGKWSSLQWPDATLTWYNIVWQLIWHLFWHGFLKTILHFVWHALESFWHFVWYTVCKPTCFHLSDISYTFFSKHSDFWWLTTWVWNFDTPFCLQYGISGMYSGILIGILTFCTYWHSEGHVWPFSGHSNWHFEHLIWLAYASLPFCMKKHPNFESF